MLKKALIIITILISLMLPVVSLSSPASAGQDYWSYDCNNSQGEPIWWYNQTGYYGTRYVHRWYGVVQGPFRVDEIAMDIYSGEGWQCGWMGAPLSNWYGGQTFENAWIEFSYELGGCYVIQHRWSRWRSGCLA